MSDLSGRVHYDPIVVSGESRPRVRDRMRVAPPPTPAGSGRATG